MAREAVCAVCSAAFTARRKDSRTCSKPCWRKLYEDESQAPNKKRQQAASSKPGRELAQRRRHAEELMENDRRAVQMAFAGADIKQIQQALGYTTWGGAQAALQRGMKIYRSFLDDIDPGDMRAFEIARCDWEIRQMLPAIMNPGPKTDVKGNPIRDPATGDIVPDFKTKIEALTLYDKIAGRMAALKGVEPPKQPSTVIIPVSHVLQGVEVDQLR